MDDTPTPYEVRCGACQTSFPIGTRQCIHCGRRIRGARAPRTRLGRPEVDPQVVVRDPGLSGAPMERSAGAEMDPEAYGDERRGEEEAQDVGSPFRISLWTLSVGLALLGSMLRQCQGG